NNRLGGFRQQRVDAAHFGDIGLQAVAGELGLDFDRLGIVFRLGQRLGDVENILPALGSEIDQGRTDFLALFNRDIAGVDKGFGAVLVVELRAFKRLDGFLVAGLALGDNFLVVGLKRFGIGLECLFRSFRAAQERVLKRLADRKSTRLN